MRRTLRLWIVLVGLVAYGIALVPADDAVPMPAPFDSYTMVELIRQVYLQFSPQTHLLGKNIVDDVGRGRADEFYEAKIWKG